MVSRNRNIRRLCLCSLFPLFLCVVLCVAWRTRHEFEGKFCVIGNHFTAWSCSLVYRTSEVLFGNTTIHCCLVIPRQACSSAVPWGFCRGCDMQFVIAAGATTATAIAATAVTAVAATVVTTITVGTTVGASGVVFLHRWLSV